MSLGGCPPHMWMEMSHMTLIHHFTSFFSEYDHQQWKTPTFIHCKYFCCSSKILYFCQWWKKRFDMRNIDICILKHLLLYGTYIVAIYSWERLGFEPRLSAFWLEAHLLSRFLLSTCLTICNVKFSKQYFGTSVVTIIMLVVTHWRLY